MFAYAVDSYPKQQDSWLHGNRQIALSLGYTVTNQGAQHGHEQCGEASQLPEKKNH